MLITAEELAPQLKISVGQVYRLARSRQIPAYHLGKAVRFNLQEVMTATATPPPRTTVYKRLDWRTA